MMKTTHLFTLLASGALLTGVSCTQHQQNYALGGAAAGAAAGALFGDSDDVVRGAAIGAAAGAGTAAYQENQNRKAGAYNTGGDYSRTPAPQAPRYKTATPTGQAGIVRSPYRPYQKVRVSGLKSGDLAKVPGTNDIFIVP